MIRRPPRSTPFPTRRSSDLLLRWRGVGVLVTTRGPQQPSLEKEAVKPKIERASGIVKSSVGDKTAGELRWEKPNARMGKEITEKYGKHNRTGNGENINRNTIYPVEVQ